MSSGTAADGWLAIGDPGGTAPSAPWPMRWTVPLTEEAVVAGADGALLVWPVTVLLTWLATVRAAGLVTVLMTVGRTLAADVTLAGTEGTGWLGGCGPAGCPGAPGPWP